MAIFARSLPIPFAVCPLRPPQAKIPFSYIDSQYKWNWSITLAPGKKYALKQNEYLIIFDPGNSYFYTDGHLMKKYSDYTGYLTTYENTEILLEDLGFNTERIYPKRWYPTAQYRPYKEVTPNELFYFIGEWGDRYFENRYKTLQCMLAQKSYTSLFGNPIHGEPYGKAFKGPIDFDGESVLDLISEKGVCLVLHSGSHLRHKIPSGRIFEAAAASAVIICDLNPFVIEHFGDSVLYIDQNLSGEELFEQIDANMHWIQEHPKEALEMARRAHQVFEERFLLENQLLDFDRFYLII